MTRSERLPKPSGGERLNAADRAAQAINLRRTGASYRDIALALGFAGPSGAYQAVRNAIARVTVEPAKEMVLLEAERLDRLQRAHWAAATQDTIKTRDAKGNVVDHVVTVAERAKASSEILKIMTRRAALFGLDSPFRIEQNVSEHVRPMTQAEIAAIEALWPTTPDNADDQESDRVLALTMASEGA